MTEVKKKLTREEANKRFASLSWKILEAKWDYYIGPEFDVKPMADEKFDKMEEIYRKLATGLKLEPTAAEHVGFPMHTASGRLVHEKKMSKIKNKKGS